MRKIAIILLLLFVMSEAYPSLHSLLFADISTGFSITKDVPVEDKNDSTKKEKKSLIPLLSLSIKDSYSFETAFHTIEKIFPSPCLEKLTPPPNFI